MEFNDRRFERTELRVLRYRTACRPPMGETQRHKPELATRSGEKQNGFARSRTKYLTFDRDHLLELIRTTHRPPSSTTMYKHRFMLVAGYISYVAEKHRRLFEEDNRIVRFCTMDGLPQHGYDWLLHGSISISARECVRLFDVANEYIVRCLQQGVRGGDDRRALELRFCCYRCFIKY